MSEPAHPWGQLKTGGVTRDWWWAPLSVRQFASTTFSFHPLEQKRMRGTENKRKCRGEVAVAETSQLETVIPIYSFKHENLLSEFYISTLPKRGVNSTSNLRTWIKSLTSKWIRWFAYWLTQNKVLIQFLELRTSNSLGDAFGVEISHMCIEKLSSRFNIWSVLLDHSSHAFISNVAWVLRKIKNHWIEMSAQPFSESKTECCDEV